MPLIQNKFPCVYDGLENNGKICEVDYSEQELIDKFTPYIAFYCKQYSQDNQIESNNC